MTNNKKTTPCKQEEDFLEALAKDAAVGKEESFSRLANSFLPVIYALIAPLSVPLNEKEDLVQEGLIGLYKAVRLFDPTLSSFATFARLCIRSALIDGVRKVHDQGQPLDLAELEDTIPASPTETPERILMGKEDLQELLQKVDRALSPLERRIFGLHLHGKSISEIALIVGKERKSVENALFRLRKKLSASL